MRVLLTFLLCSFISGNPYFPGETWETKTIDEVGLDELKVEELFTYLSDDATMSAVLIKDGYIIKNNMRRF